MILLYFLLRRIFSPFILPIFSEFFVAAKFKGATMYLSQGNTTSQDD